MKFLLVLCCKLILHNLHPASLFILQISCDYHAVNMACTFLAYYKYFIAEVESTSFFHFTCGVNASLL